MKYVSLIGIALILQILISRNASAQDAGLIKYINDADHITAHAETDKFYWIGTDNGLFCIRKKNNKVFHMTAKNSALLSDSITCIATKSNGEVYIGTTSGIVRYDNYTFLLVSSENSQLKSDKITSLVSVNGSEIFAGTYNGGITIFSELRSKTYTKKNAPLENDHVVSLEKFGADSLVAFLENNLRVGIKGRRFTMIDHPGR